MEEADELADRICLMKDGRIQTIQTPSELKKSYADGFKFNVSLNQNGFMHN